MSFFNNKFFISFLILTVAIYGLSVKTAQAGGFVGDVFKIVVVIAITVVVASLTSGLGAALVGAIPSATSGAILAGAIVGGLVGAAVGASWATQCVAPNNPLGQGPISMCGGGSSSQWQGAAGSPILQDQTATPIVNSDKTGTCTTGFTLNYTVTDAYKAGIYRDGASIYQSGFLGDERVSHPMVSYDEYGNLEFPSDCTPDETLAYDSDGNPIYDYKYDSDGNLISKKQRVNVLTCTKKEYYSWPSPHNYSFSYTDSGLAPNKDYKYELVLMDLNGKQYRYPQLNAYSECIKLDLKVNDTDGPDTVKVASNYATLNWITEGALSCSASGDWSGSKGPATGREELGRIARGTSNPGLGKTYNYSMTCNYPKDKTLSDSVSVTVFKYPECDFSADPAVIEVLPATSTLSWDCRYYGGTPDEGSDSCSINQGIGSVSPLNDSVSVRPSQETTYTLTCSTIDKTSDYFLTSRLISAVK